MGILASKDPESSILTSILGIRRQGEARIISIRRFSLAGLEFLVAKRQVRTLILWKSE